MGLQLWALAYAMPALIAVYVSNTLPVKRGLINANLLVVLSIIFMTLAGARVEWSVSALSLTVFSASTIVAVYFLRATGILYALSAVAQQYCILLASLLMQPTTGILIAGAATACLFALAHKLRTPEWRWKAPLLFIFGIASILLYEWLREPLLNFALHIALGTLLISKGYLYESTN